jgi:methylated-DNA-[protein]-cysteine S-methyltransferase
MSAPPTIWTSYESPLGTLTLIAGEHGITQLRFAHEPPRLATAIERAMPDVTGQLDEYFAGRRQVFELELDPHGSALQMQVWQRLLQIPYGETTSYGKVAASVEEALYEPGHEPYMRARVVGGAIGANPIPILIPCHRVIGANGSLTGYRGGLPRKRTLLELEGAEAVSERTEMNGGDGQLALL